MRNQIDSDSNKKKGYEGIRKTKEAMRIGRE